MAASMILGMLSAFANERLAHYDFGPLTQDPEGVAAPFVRLEATFADNAVTEDDLTGADAINDEVISNKLNITVGNANEKVLLVLFGAAPYLVPTLESETSTLIAGFINNACIRHKGGNHERWIHIGQAAETLNVRDMASGAGTGVYTHREGKVVDFVDPIIVDVEKDEFVAYLAKAQNFATGAMTATIPFIGAAFGNDALPDGVKRTACGGVQGRGTMKPLNLEQRAILIQKAKQQVIRALHVG